MGEFKAGVWIVALVIYFSMFLFIATAVTQSANEYGLSHEISVGDPGFKTITGAYDSVSGNTTVDPLAEQNSNSVIDTIGFMSGFSGELGIPGIIKWIFVTLFFWIPALMLGFAVYMVLPFIH